MAKAKIKKVVFVCTGNTCRSPMAEAAFAREIQSKGLSAVVTSAGLRLSPDERDLSENAVLALRKNGLSLPYFSSTSLTKETLLNADIILCMTRAQRDTLKSARKRLAAEQGGTRVRNNVFCFAELIGEDIPDPYGKSVDEYLIAFNKITAAFPVMEEKWFTKKPRACKRQKTDYRPAHVCEKAEGKKKKDGVQAEENESGKKAVETSGKRRRNA